MRKFRPIIIVAVDSRGGFGKDGKIPWHLPEDLKRFKEITTNHICVMGRRTYNEILDARLVRDKEKGDTGPIEQVLRGRDSFVVTSNEDMPTPGATKIKSLYDIHKHISSEDTRQIFVIGGYKMFTEAFSWCEQIFMTVIKGDHYNCDVTFPIEWLNKKWKIVSGQESEKAYFVVYNRK